MNNKITIIIPTYKRTDLLLRDDNPILNQMNENKDIIDKILLIWQDTDSQPPQELYHKIEELEIKVVIIISKKNSLNNRFIPYDNINTNCIFSIDDDYYVDTRSFRKGYHIWLKNQDTIVGFAPRYINNNTYHGNAYDSKLEPYNIILTGGGSFFHNRYLKMYSENDNITNIVDKYFNGEDIALNFIIVNHSHNSPIFIESKAKTWIRHKVALNSRKNHLSGRFKVYKELLSLFGNESLIKTHEQK